MGRHPAASRSSGKNRLSAQVHHHARTGYGYHSYWARTWHRRNGRAEHDKRYRREADDKPSAYAGAYQPDGRTRRHENKRRRASLYRTHAAPRTEAARRNLLNEGRGDDEDH